MKLSSHELATVLAALRHWQQNVLNGTRVFNPDEYDHFDDDARPLSAEGVDELCERLNCYAPPVLILNVTGGVVQGVLSDRPDDLDVAAVITLDYDTDDDENAIEVPQDGGGTEPAYVGTHEIEAWPLAAEIAKIAAAGIADERHIGVTDARSAYPLMALVSPQGTACPETVLNAHEDSPEARAKIEARYCNGGWDDPVAGSWQDVTDNEACNPHLETHLALKGAGLL